MKESSRPLQEDLAELLAPTETARGIRRRWLVVTALAAAIVAGFSWLGSGDAVTGPRYETQTATVGPLRVTVSATGHLLPINQVDVGTEISGLVEIVTVDDNDRVEKGQVLARLDEARLRDEIVRSKAALATAEARVMQVSASVRELAANFERLREVERLSGGKVPSRLELDAASAALERALADEAGALAAVEEASARLSSDETLLEKASVVSPIDGVVLARHVEPGQTVAATLQTPILFTLAEDLSQMELQVDVDEADVGAVVDGQPATFTVDAHPRRIYEALVTRVGFGSQIEAGVVSYLTVLRVDNDDLSLRPGMTATAEILTAALDDVLLVPNAALRFRPPERSGESSRSFLSRLVPRPPVDEKERRDPDDHEIWVLEEGEARPVDVTIGATDGRWTLIQAGDLEPGAEVITARLEMPR